MGLLGIVGDTIRGIGQGAQGLLNQPQQQGLLGGTQPSLMPQAQPPAAIPQQNAFGFAMGQLADVVGNWGKTPEEMARTEYLKSQATDQKAQAAARGMPFGGESFDNQLVRQRAQEYMKAGVPAQEALSRAANDVLSTKQDYVADPMNPGALMPVGRKALPPVAGQSAQPPLMPQGSIQEEPLPPAGGQGGMLLPPPSGSGTPDASVFSPRNFDPSKMNPYENTGAVQLTAAKAKAEADARNQADKEANGGVAKTSESQNQAGARAMLVSQGFNNLRAALDSQNVDPTNLAIGNAAGNFAGKLGGDDLGNAVKGKLLNSDEQAVNYGESQAMEGLIGLATGAGVAGAQIEHFKAMRPTIYDSPAVREKKFADAQQYLLQAMDAAGPLGQRVPNIAAASPASLPQGVTEEDIQHTMKLHNVSRDEVLKRLGK